MNSIAHLPQTSPRTCVLDTPIGPIGIVTENQMLRAIELTLSQPQHLYGQPETELETKIATRLGEYFSGRLVSFEDIELDLSGATAFQKAVWQQLKIIPYGEVRTYRWLSKRLHKERAYRAVGQANRKNPIPIIIPCHRIINADGTLGGYQGKPESNIKSFLLKLEQSGRKKTTSS